MSKKLSVLVFLALLVILVATGTTGWTAPTVGQTCPTYIGEKATIISFSAHPEDTADIYVMSGMGAIYKVASEPYAAFDAHLFRTGRKLAYDTSVIYEDNYIAWEIVTLDLLTGVKTHVTHRGKDTYPTWSPDGNS